MVVKSIVLIPASVVVYVVLATFPYNTNDLLSSRKNWRRSVAGVRWYYIYPGPESIKEIYHFQVALDPFTYSDVRVVANQTEFATYRSPTAPIIIDRPSQCWNELYMCYIPIYRELLETMPGWLFGRTQLVDMWLLVIHCQDLMKIHWHKWHNTRDSIILLFMRFFLVHRNYPSMMEFQPIMSPQGRFDTFLCWITTWKCNIMQLQNGPYNFLVLPSSWSLYQKDVLILLAKHHLSNEMVSILSDRWLHDPTRINPWEEGVIYQADQMLCGKIGTRPCHWVDIGFSLVQKVFLGTDIASPSGVTNVCTGLSIAMEQTGKAHHFGHASLQCW